MIRIHDMPFGAVLTGSGAVRFRLWAPAAQHVDLCLELGERRKNIAMAEGVPGWYEAVIAERGPGTRYRYVIDGEMEVPDPASRFQPGDVHGASEVIDPSAFDWADGAWQGRPWEEAVIYELHVGTFTPAGTFDGVIDRLDYLAELGITAVELMPVADWPGARNWGYDGAYAFAPDARYGRPEELKRLVQEAHARGLMVFLDVVYNHFGPEGNYLHCYAPQFFTDRYHTPWGMAIDFEGPDSRTVREFFIHNALYWIEEYHVDGLRLDAVHSIFDQSHPDILTQLAQTVKSRLPDDRHVHLILENDRNEARYLERDGEGRPKLYTAQWNDDIHHAFHVLATGEKSGYYVDYADDPIHAVGRALAEGFVYQGDPSPYRKNARRGEPSAHLSPLAFVSFLQNHDQIGNRAFGERINAIADDQAVHALTVLTLLAPAPPLVFMGQEWGASTPFPFFSDFEPSLADSVREGRREEFSHFPQFRDKDALAGIPDPLEPATFRSAVLDWSERERAPHDRWLARFRELMAIRCSEIIPRLSGCGWERAFSRLGPTIILVWWTLGDGSKLQALANLSAASAKLDVALPDGRLLYSTTDADAQETLSPWTVTFYLKDLDWEGPHGP